ncbi:MAG: hypothetical protein H0U75_05480 [Legionella sp.]|nr:hypothetical protein [Legionella sp.]
MKKNKSIIELSFYETEIDRRTSLTVLKALEDLPRIEKLQLGLLLDENEISKFIENNKSVKELSLRRLRPGGLYPNAEIFKNAVRNNHTLTTINFALGQDKTFNVDEFLERNRTQQNSLPKSEVKEVKEEITRDNVVDILLQTGCDKDTLTNLFGNLDEAPKANFNPT